MRPAVGWTKWTMWTLWTEILGLAVHHVHAVHFVHSSARFGAGGRVRRSSRRLTPPAIICRRFAAPGSHTSASRRLVHPPRGCRRPASCSFLTGSSRTAGPGGGRQPALAGQPRQQVGPSPHPWAERCTGRNLWAPTVQEEPWETGPAPRFLSLAPDRGVLCPLADSPSMWRRPEGMDGGSGGWMVERGNIRALAPPAHSPTDPLFHSSILPPFHSSPQGGEPCLSRQSPAGIARGSGPAPRLFPESTRRAGDAIIRACAEAGQ